MITTGPVGKPLGKDASGFRVVIVHQANIQHQYYGMDDVPKTINLAKAAQTGDRRVKRTHFGVEIGPTL